MAFTLELSLEIPQVLTDYWRVLRNEGRIVLAGISKEAEDGFILHVFKWTPQHFPNFLDCRLIFVYRLLEAASFHLVKRDKQPIWGPVEIDLALKQALATQ